MLRRRKVAALVLVGLSLRGLAARLVINEETVPRVASPLRNLDRVAVHANALTAAQLIARFRAAPVDRDPALDDPAIYLAP
jgi:hypothetical protein